MLCDELSERFTINKLFWNSVTGESHGQSTNHFEHVFYSSDFIYFALLQCHLKLSSFRGYGL